MPLKTELWPGWETVGLIGKGGYGSVYEISRTFFDTTEKAALKVLTIPQNSGEIEELYGEGYDQQSISTIYAQHAKGILAEYTFMKQMSNCVNIVSCDDMRYERHEDGIGWDIYIKMELLTPLMKAFPGTVTDRLVIKLGKDICNALTVCKQHGVIHRDIKPQNIFVDGNGTFKLGDFGIAKAVERTTGGTKIGTYKYMAPEVYNNQPYGSASDIYSLGLVLYWLLNERRMPFSPMPPTIPSYSDEELAKQRRFRGEVLPRPKYGSAALQDVILKACAFDPKDRYGSAAQMLAALEMLERPRPAVTDTDITERVRSVKAVVDPAEEIAAEKPADDAPGITTEEEKQNERKLIAGVFIALTVFLVMILIAARYYTN